MIENCGHGGKYANLDDGEDFLGHRDSEVHILLGVRERHEAGLVLRAGSHTVGQQSRKGQGRLTSGASQQNGQRMRRESGGARRATREPKGACAASLGEGSSEA